MTLANTLDISKIDFAKGDGLVPVVVQDAATLQVLTLAYMDRAALDEDLKDALLRYRALKAPPGAAATAKPDAQAGPAPAAG